jgi:S1-C subfamily serine protease
MSDDVEPFPPAVRPSGAPDDAAEASADSQPTGAPSWSPWTTPTASPGAAPVPPDGEAQAPSAPEPGRTTSWPAPAWGTPGGPSSWSGAESGWAGSAGPGGGPGGPGGGADAGGYPAGGGGWPGAGGWGPSQPGAGGGWGPEGAGGWGPQVAGGGGGWGPPGGGGGWGQPPWGQSPGGYQTGPPRNAGRRGLAAAIVAVVVAAFVGVGVGRAINSTRTRTVTVSPFTPQQPFGGENGGGFGGFGGGGGSTGNSTGGQVNNATVAGVEKGVVDINTKLGYQSASAAGTGMVLTSNGEVLTNNHVIDGATAITATVVTTGKTYAAKVVGEDPTADVAVIQLQGASGLSTVPLGDSATVSSGDTVIAIGNAGGVGGAPSVVSGSVLALGQSITASDIGGANAERLSNLIEMNAPIEPGDSGGPLVNSAGKVIGMNTAASTSGRFQVAANTAFAIPINDALSVVHQIESGQSSSTVHLGLPGFLGVSVDPQGTANGALISSVVSGSAASKIGLQQGDVVTAVDGQKVSQASDLSGLLQAHHPGDRVTLTWADQSGSSHTATATLGTGPAN